MNYIDIIILALLALAMFFGFRQGVIKQVCSLVGVVIGILIGRSYSSTIGHWLCGDRNSAYVVGFVVTLIAIIILMAIIAYLLQKFFKVAGFGFVDSLLGAALSLFKYCLILSILFSLFNALNEDMKLVKRSTLNSSKLYAPIKGMSSRFYPVVDWSQKQIDSGFKKLR